MKTIDVKEEIIEPVLHKLNWHSGNAVKLLLGVCAQESHMGEYLKQIKGPAKSIYQIEPKTYNAIVKYLYERRFTSYKRIRDSFCIGDDLENSFEQITGNLYLATAITRAHFIRFPKPIPGTIDGIAKYWKQYYNSYKGAGTIEQFKENYSNYVGGT